MNHVLLHASSDFRKALNKMTRAGGQTALAAEELKRIIGDLRLGETEPARLGRLTKHGESRIDHCFKFDLPGFCRLVIRTNKRGSDVSCAFTESVI